MVSYGTQLISILHIISAPLDYSNEEAQPAYTEWPSKRVKNQVHGLFRVLAQNQRVFEQNQVIDVVAEALLKSILALPELPSRPALSLLFLGLTSVGRAGLERSLSKNFVGDDGINLLIQIDLSNYSDSDSLFRLIYGPLQFSSSHNQHGLPLLEAVRMRPHSILLFSQVEKAHISVFSALLAVLEHGKLGDFEGQTVDFRKTVVIVASDLGNSVLLAKVVGLASPQDVVSDEVIPAVQPNARSFQQEKRGFRSELINRVDENMFFNPSAREQLRKVARLPMKCGPHLEEGPLAFSTGISDLFRPASDPICESLPSAMETAVSYFTKGLISIKLW